MIATPAGMRSRGRGREREEGERGRKGQTDKVADQIE
jgi:hypothetical protein